MANATPSRVLQKNQTGDERALGLVKFAGETITAFEETNVFMGLTQVRTIDSGKGASFPSSWKGTAGYHVPGTELLGTKVGHNERVIMVDDLLVADRAVANIDEAMSHYDVRGPYAKDVGRALAQAMDRNIARTLYLASRTAANITGAFGGTQITSASAATSADSLIAAAFDAAQTFDEKDVPSDGRYLAVKPAQYYLLADSGSKLVHRDYAPESNGSLSKGTVMEVAGLKIVKSNNLPNGENSVGSATIPSTYQGNFTNSLAVAFHSTAVGTVKLIDLTVRADWIADKLVWLIVGMLAVGHGVLRPECSIEIKTA